MGKHKVGLIGVGQGPRLDNRSGITNWFKHTGADVEILERGLFDGMSLEEARALQGAPPDPSNLGTSPDTRCGGWIHNEGGKTFLFGDGWGEVWTPRKWNAERMQYVIDQLVDDGAEVIIECCSLRTPDFAIKSKVPVVFPWKCEFNYVRALAETMERPRVAVIRGGKHTIERDWLYWTENDWMKTVDFHLVDGFENFFIPDSDDDFLVSSAVESLRDVGKLDLAVIWGWQWFDLRKGVVGSQECQQLRLSRELGCPVISSISSALLFARGLITPPIDEKSFLTPMRNLHGDVVTNMNSLD